MFWIGTSGWSYEHWDGVLYPPRLPAHERLAHYLRHYRTVAVNSTFYRWPSVATFASWRRRLPEGFRLAIKTPRGLTHGARLYAPERWLARLAAGLAALGERRGPLLVQLPPDLPRDFPRLAYFLARVPPWIGVTCEFRHPSWHDEETFALLEAHGAAYCVMSGAGLPCCAARHRAIRLRAPARPGSALSLRGLV